MGSSNLQTPNVALVDLQTSDPTGVLPGPHLAVKRGATATSGSQAKNNRQAPGGNESQDPSA